MPRYRVTTVWEVEADNAEQASGMEFADNVQPISCIAECVELVGVGLVEVTTRAKLKARITKLEEFIINVACIIQASYPYEGAKRLQKMAKEIEGGEPCQGTR